MAFDVASIKPSKGPFVPSNFPLDPSEDYSATNGRRIRGCDRRNADFNLHRFPAAIEPAVMFRRSYLPVPLT